MTHTIMYFSVTEVRLHRKFVVSRVDPPAFHDLEVPGPGCGDGNPRGLIAAASRC